VEGYFSENELLENYCDLYLDLPGNIDAVKERLKRENDKVRWIRLFFENFVELADCAKGIVKNKYKANISNLFFIGDQVNLFQA
jgi:hypothetical protein